MASIELRFFTGDVERRELSKKQPLSIGRHPSNDVSIDEDEVGAMHCRIAWSKSGYELTSATSEGVEVNGARVQNALLNDGDVVRIGTVDIAVLLDGTSGGGSAGKAGGRRAAEAKAAGSSAAVAAPRQSARSLPDDLFDDGGDSDSGELVAEVDDDEDVEPPRRRGRNADLDAGLEPDDDENDNDDDERDSDSPSGGAKGTSSAVNRLRQRLDARSVRPGEQDVIRSKFLHTLGWGMLILLLAIGVFWYWTQLSAAERHFNIAAELHDEGKYQQAIDVYTDFLEKYPGSNEYAVKAFYARAKARIDRYVNGASPDWGKAMEQLEEFPKENREREGFVEQQPVLLEYAMQIANGAAASAEKDKLRKWLPVAEQARNFARQYKADEDFLRSFEVKRKRAEAEVIRREAYDEAVAAIEAAILNSDVTDALKQRIDFQRRYPDARPTESRKLDALLEKTMQAEKSLIQLAELNRPGVSQDRPARARNPRSLTLQVRPPDGRSSDRTQIVLGTAKHCIYGLDAVTGVPVWRRAVGMDSPFFPLKLEVGKPAALAYDNRFGEFVLIDLLDGSLIWRRQLADDGERPERLTGAPLVHQGQIFAPTLSRRLYKLDLASGRAVDRLEFSQKLLAPPVVAPDNERLVVAGDTALVYTVRLNPKLECESVHYVGHATGAVRAPLVRIGQLVLMCDNDRADSCRLRVLNTSPNGDWLEELTFPGERDQIRVNGAVRDQPALRERILYISSSRFPRPLEPAAARTGSPAGKPADDDDDEDDASSPERDRRNKPRQFITAFSVSDDTQRPQSERTFDQFLSRIAELPIDDVHDGPLYLVTGPNDQLWLASNRLRKFHLKTRNIQRSTAEDVAVGRVAQPPQVVGGQAYLGRQSDYSSAVNLTQNDIDEMGNGTWRSVLGAGLLAWSTSDGNPAICLNEDGQVFRIPADELGTGGFQLQSSARIRPKDATEPLRAVGLPDGKLAVAGGGSEPTLWIVGATGQIERSIPLPNPLQCDPAPLGDGILLPLPGRIRYVAFGGARIGDFQAPFEVGEGEQPKWTQLAPVSETMFVAADTQGALRQIELRTAAGGRHLAQTVERKLSPPAAYGFAAAGSNLVLADSGGGVHLINPNTLQPSDTVAAGGTVTNSVFASGGLAFVEVGRNRLQCYAADGGLKKRWELTLAGSSGLAGAPVEFNGRLIVAERDGTLHSVDPVAGDSRIAAELGEPLSHSPRVVDGTVVVPSIDGSLHSVNPAEQRREAP